MRVCKYRQRCAHQSLFQDDSSPQFDLGSLATGGQCGTNPTCVSGYSPAPNAAGGTQCVCTYGTADSMGRCTTCREVSLASTSKSKSKRNTGLPHHFAQWSQHLYLRKRSIRWVIKLTFYRTTDDGYQTSAVPANVLPATAAMLSFAANAFRNVPRQQIVLALHLSARLILKPAALHVTRTVNVLEDKSACKVPARLALRLAAVHLKALCALMVCLSSPLCAYI